MCEVLSQKLDARVLLTNLSVSLQKRLSSLETVLTVTNSLKNPNVKALSFWMDEGWSKVIFTKVSKLRCS